VLSGDGVLDNSSLGEAADSALGWVIETFGWMFVLSTLGFLALAIYLGVSRFGKIRLGADDGGSTAWRSSRRCSAARRRSGSARCRSTAA
jgi:choline-glycine betaine transporter